MVLTKIPDQMLQSAGGSGGALGQKVDIRTLGADPTGNVDIAPIIQECLDNGILPYISGGTYLWNTQVDIPEGTNLGIYSDPTAFITTTEDITLLSCVRTTPSLESRSTFVIENCWFQQNGTIGTGRVINMQGIDVIWDDNTLFVRGNHSAFRGFNHAIEIGNASARVYDAYFVFNTVGIFLNYNASFLWFTDLLFLVNDFAIYGDSGVYDGITNSICITNCTAVNSKFTDYRISGWDAITIIGGGTDLGGANDPNLGTGSYAIYLHRCSNINIQNSYISSFLSAAPNRVGLALVDCVKATVTGTRLYTSLVGLYIESSLGLPAGHIITNNFFGGNTRNHLWINSAQSVTISSNKFDATPNRIGTNYEVVCSASGNTYMNFRQNDFAGTSYALGIVQTGSLAETQRWGVPLI